MCSPITLTSFTLPPGRSLASVVDAQEDVTGDEAGDVLNNVARCA